MCVPVVQDQPYPMNLPRLGHAVIVNNVASEMVGSRKDVVALKAAYETIGFDVHIYEDCAGQVITTWFY